ncbi:MAG: ribosome maturation factor RimP [Microcystaceae cyanobacterium]
MTHPLIPQIIEIATPIAEELTLEVVEAVFQTNKRPPTLRVDIRNPKQDTSLNDCERMSRALEEALDRLDLIPGAYTLEVSSPGTTRKLNSDREFTAFKGFPVVVKTYSPYQNKKEWLGNLQGRDEEAIYLQQKGRAIALPRQLVASVQLAH